MSKVKYYLEKYKIYIIILSVVVFIVGLLLCLFLKKEEVIASEIIVEKEEVKEIKEEIKTVKVDVKGRVKKEGVYELKENDRVIDAINKAGGLKENANTEYINLSKKLVDEMIIIIYSDEDINKFKEEEKQIIYIEYKCECPDNINDSCIVEEDIVNTNGVVENNDKSDNNEQIEEKQEKDLISINKGTLEELMTLPGVGESKAKSIIEYREKNKFEKLEDIMNVSGIGESAYSKIKDLIKL